MQKQQRPPFGLRMPKDLHEWVKMKAKEQDRSMNNYIVHLLEGRKAEEASTNK